MIRRTGRLLLGSPEVLALLAFFAVGTIGFLLPYKAGADVDMKHAFAGPSLEHLLGTDWLGRDLLKRFLASTRAFFLPGLIASGITVVLGIGLGAFAGYVGERTGLHGETGPVRRIVDGARKLVSLLLALPGTLPRFVTIALCSAAFGFGAFLLAGVAGVLYAADLGEEIKLRVESCSREEYVESARADGLSWQRILGYHILWLQARAIVFRYIVQLWIFVIITETSLSFLPGSYGVQEPQPSWGNMLIGAREGVMLGHFWPALLPTVGIICAIIALGWMSDSPDAGHQLLTNLEEPALAAAPLDPGGTAEPAGGGA